MSDLAHRRRALAAGAVLLVLLGRCSVGLAQQTTPASRADESLVDKVNDPTASLTQLKIQDIYTPAEYGTNAHPNTLQLRPLFAVRPRLFTPLEQAHPADDSSRDSSA